MYVWANQSSASANEKNSEAEPMTKLKLIRLFSLDAIAVISAVALCVILVTDPSLLG
jgi:hypothetical protein